MNVVSYCTTFRFTGSRTTLQRERVPGNHSGRDIQHGGGACGTFPLFFTPSINPRLFRTPKKNMLLPHQVIFRLPSAHDSDGIRDSSIYRVSPHGLHLFIEPHNRHGNQNQEIDKKADHARDSSAAHADNRFLLFIDCHSAVLPASALKE